MSSASATDCLFCKLRDGQIPATVTHRDADVVAFRDLKPGAPLHELVIPTRHIASLSDARPEDAALLGKLMLTAAERARAEGHSEGGYRVVMNAGPDAGQSVLHIHLHVLAGRPLAWPPG
jgi:histidine triad (HIT) family protein